MEEREYKYTYHAINRQRCVFEKTVNSRRSTCSSARRFHLADREGIACTSQSGCDLCTELLASMRSNARFALHVTSAGGPLPHNKEIKVQTGGMLGLQTVVYPDRAEDRKVIDIIGIIRQALTIYGSIGQLPYERIVQSIVKFEGRKRRARDNKD